MRCNTLLCGNAATYVNIQTKEKKCASCKDKRVDRDSLYWFPLAEEEESPYAEIPKAVPRNKYSVSKGGTRNLWFVCRDDQKESYSYVCHTEEEAIKVCDALNKAYKLGANSVLHKLQKFSLDIRREHGILWGDADTTQNKNF